MIIKKAELADFDLFYELKSDSVNIYWTGHKNAPNKDNLHLWFQKIVLNSKKNIYLAKDEFKKAIGYAYIDILDDTTIESSVGVLFKQKGKGYATKLIYSSLKLFLTPQNQYNTCLAWIAQDNIGSIRAYEKNGFVLTPNTKEVVFSDDTIKLFNCYKLKLH